MAEYTRADFDADYVFNAESRMPGGYPVRPGGQVKLHYCRQFMAPILAARWANLAPIINASPADRILVVGAGFGWGVEAAIAETGATVVGTDVSAYVQANLTTSEDQELREAIIAAGLDPDTGRGLEIFTHYSNPAPRSNVIVLNEDSQTNTSRQAIRSALGGWPTICVVEDIVTDSDTDQLITQVKNALDNFAGSQTNFWLYTETPARSAEQLKAVVTPHTVVTTVDWRVL